jgi:ribosomal protein S18 acetylase RimI-like enzyme
MGALLDDILWNCLSGPHAKFAAGSGGARRYAPGFSPIVGFREPERADFSELDPYCGPGETFYFDRWSGPEPAGWRIEHEGTMFKMVWSEPAPAEDPAPDAVALGPEHASLALALAQLTKPGPFGARTLELGEYFGYFAGPRLIAMAGERLCAGAYREISGVCTHPDYRGHGLAEKLTLKLVRRELAQNQAPFLHVVSENTVARKLYLRMGFRDYKETVARVASRLS